MIPERIIALMVESMPLWVSPAKSPFRYLISSSGLLNRFRWTLFLIARARVAYRSVLIVWSRFMSAGEQQAIITECELPPNESWRMRVSLESLAAGRNQGMVRQVGREQRPDLEFGSERRTCRARAYARPL